MSLRNVLFYGLAVAASAPLSLHAQRDLQSGGEFAIYGGLVGGGTGTHASVGGSSGVLESRYLLLLLDGSFSPLDNSLFATPLTPQVRDARQYSIDFEGHILIPVHRRWEPYGILGAGLLHTTWQTGTETLPGAVSWSGSSLDKFAFHTGGGVRYFISDNLGVRGELKVVVSTRNYVRASCGVFYVVGPEWSFRSFFARSSRQRFR